MPIRRVSAENLAEARRLYEGTRLSGEEIAAETGVSRTSLRRYAEREAWIRASGAPERETVVASLRERIEREITAAESALEGASDAKSARVEKMSRSLASLVRTLRELAKYDEEQARRGQSGDRRDDSGRRAAPQHEGDDGAAVADLDTFRAELAERIEKLRLGGRS